MVNDQFNGRMIKAWIYCLILASQVTHTISISGQWIWPIPAQGPSAETKNGVPFGAAGSDLTTCASHPELDYETVYFPGTDNSYIDIGLTDTQLIKRLAFSIYIDAAPPYSYVIFHFRASNPPEDTVSEIMLWANGSHIILDTLIKGGSKLDSVAIQNIFSNSTTEFVPFSFGYNEHGDVQFTTYDVSLMFTRLNQWGDPPMFSIPCRIRLGKAQTTATLSGSSIFKGRLTCLQLYTDMFDPHDYDSTQEKCLSTKWGTQPSSSALPPMSPCPNDDGSRYTMSALNEIPSTSTPHLETLPAGSKLRCAEKCAKLSTCLSFSIEIGVKTCRLFDSVIDSGMLVSSANSKYYTRQSNGPCCL